MKQITILLAIIFSYIHIVSSQTTYGIERIYIHNGCSFKYGVVPIYGLRSPSLSLGASNRVSGMPFGGSRVYAYEHYKDNSTGDIFVKYYVPNGLSGGNISVYSFVDACMMECECCNYSNQQYVTIPSNTRIRKTAGGSLLYIQNTYGHSWITTGDAYVFSGQKYAWTGNRVLNTKIGGTGTAYDWYEIYTSRNVFDATSVGTQMTRGWIAVSIGTNPTSSFSTPLNPSATNNSPKPIGQAIQFTDNTSNKTGGSALPEFRWDFGQGSTTNTTGNPVSFTYNSNGNYTANCNVFAYRGECISNTTVCVSPRALFTMSSSGLTVTLLDWSTGTISSRTIDYGDGTGNTSSLSHTYSTSGTYTISFTATGPGGCSHTTTGSVTITCTNPVASFYPSVKIVTVGTQVTLNSTSTGSAGVHQWTLKDQLGNVQTLTGNPVNFNAKTLGYYSVSLTVFSSCSGSSNIKTDPKSVKVIPNPIAKLSPKEVATKKSQVVAGDPVFIATGDLSLIFKTIQSSSRIGKIQHEISYSSVNSDYIKDIGYGITHSFDYWCDTSNPVLWTVHHGDGRYSYYANYGNEGTIPLHSQFNDSFYRIAVTGKCVLVHKNGTKVVFNSNGTLDNIEDLCNNKIQVTYTSPNLVKINLPGGRLFNFYKNNLNFIDSITNDIGQSIIFNRDLNNNLIELISYGNASKFNYYSGTHLIKEMIDPNGNIALKNYYNSYKEVIKQVDAKGDSSFYNTVKTSYGFLATYKDRRGITTKFHFDSFYNLIEQIDPINKSSKQKFNKSNYPIESIDRNGYYTRIIYNSDNEPLEISKPLGYKIKVGYKYYNCPSSVVDPELSVWAFDYYSNRKLKSLTDPEGNTILFGYTMYGQDSFCTDANGNKTVFKYNIYGDLISARSPNYFDSFVYDQIGRIIKYIDANLNIYILSYGVYDHIISIKDPFGNNIEWGYDNNGNNIWVKNKSGVKTILKYDIADRLVQVINPNKMIQNYKHDQEDNLIDYSISGGIKIKYNYNQNSESTKVDYILGSNSVEYGYEGELLKTFDANGNLIHRNELDSLYRVIKEFDAYGNCTQYGYNKNSTIKIKIHPSGRRFQYKYYKTGHLKETIDGNLKTQKSFYDKNWNRIKVIHPNGNSSNYRFNAENQETYFTDGIVWDSTEYDKVGLVHRTINSKGEIKTRRHDKLNRLVSVTYSGTVTGYDSTAYDHNNQIVYSQSGNNWNKRIYDSANRLVVYITSEKDTIYYFRNVNGNDTLQIVNGKPIKKKYNQVGLLTELTYASKSVKTAYNNNLQPIEKTFPNSIREVYNYDLNLNKTGITVQNTKSGNILFRQLAKYNEDQKIDSLITTNARAPRLVTKNTVGTYASNNAIINYDTLQFGHNNYGGISEISNTSGTFKDSLYHLDNDRLRRVAGTSGVYGFDYNQDNEIVQCNHNNTVRKFLRDINSEYDFVVQVKDKSNNLICNYIAGDNIVMRDSALDICFLHYDLSGNTAVLSDSFGKNISNFAFNPFGDYPSVTGNKDILFQGNGEYGALTIVPYLQNHVNRWYNPHIGRYTSLDPFGYDLGTADAHNAYLYGLNDPLAYNDPWGLVAQNINKQDYNYGLQKPNFAKAHKILNTTSTIAGVASMAAGVTLLVAASVAVSPVIIAAAAVVASVAAISSGISSLANSYLYFREGNTRDGLLNLGGGALDLFGGKIFSLAGDRLVKVARRAILSLDNLPSLKGASWKEAEALIPENWIRSAPNKGEGIKFVNPTKKGEQIILEKGTPGAKDPLHSGPYMKVSRNGRVTRIPLKGNPTLK